MHSQLHPIKSPKSDLDLLPKGTKLSWSSVLSSVSIHPSSSLHVPARSLVASPKRIEVVHVRTRARSACLLCANVGVLVVSSVLFFFN